MAQPSYYDKEKAKLPVFTKANDLAVYTIKICSNTNTFPPEFRDAMTNDIIRTAKDIFINAWNGNGIYVATQADYDLRRRYQVLAIQKCNELLALIQIAKRLYHLKSRRVKYWTEITSEIKEMLKAWKSSDAKRYAKMLGGR